jgi:hypothetical protein
MEIKITTEDLRKKKLFVATPMYGGQCAGMFCKSTNDLSIACARYGIELRFYYLFNESLITRARNYCVDEFLRSDCTHLFFVDSDIGFSHKDVLTLLHLTDEDAGYGIVTGPYPKKTISWEKVKAAVELGYADQSPFALENFIGDYVFNPTDDITEFRIDEPVRVREAGTGFMMIDRKVFTKYAAAYPELSYLPDHARTEHFDGSREITAFFDCIIDPESKRYLSEDYMFCYNATKIGINVWMCPWMQLKHVGSYVFGGSLAAIAAIAASPTASPASNAKNYLTPQQNDVKMSGTPTPLNRQQRRAAMKTKGK